MIYGSSSATSALGSLLRKMQEETMTKPTAVPTASQDQSPIRQQIQGPIDSPEAVGSDKVVSMKPELAPAQETVSPIASTTPPVDGSTPIVPGASMTPGPGIGPSISPIAPTVPVTPTVPTSPNVPSGITPPTTPAPLAPENPTGQTPPIENKINLPNLNPSGVGSKMPTTSLANKPLMPSMIKQPGFLEKLNSQKGSTISQGQTKGMSNESKASLLKAIPWITRSSSFLSRLMLTPSILGTLMKKSTLNKAVNSMKYGGRRGSSI